MPFWNEFNGIIAKIVNVGLGDQVEMMSTIPLFIYAGYLLAESGTADRLVRFANALLGWVPGGLAIVTIGTCALFTVFTGASGVTIIALGGVLMPALVKNGYPERFSMGLIAGTGSVGLLFPPALPLFIYGTVYGLCASKPSRRCGTRGGSCSPASCPGLVLDRHAVGGRGHGRDQEEAAAPEVRLRASSATASCSRCPSCSSRSA